MITLVNAAVWTKQTVQTDASQNNSILGQGLGSETQTPNYIWIKWKSDKGGESESVSCSVICLTLFNPMDSSLPGSSVHGILQARILERVAIPYSRGSSWPRNWILVTCIAGRFFAVWAQPLLALIEATHQKQSRSLIQVWFMQPVPRHITSNHTRPSCSNTVSLLGEDTGARRRENTHLLGHDPLGFFHATWDLLLMRWW